MLRDFYVEVLSFEKNSEIINILAFNDMTSLEPYLDNIDISGIFQD
jgi:hypothetical protein